MSSDAAYNLFESLNHFSDLEQMIDNGDAENIFLECKSPTSCRLDKSQQAQLAEAISGFSNTEGGVLIYGIECTKHEIDKSDVLTNIAEIGSCKSLARNIDMLAPTLTFPYVTGVTTKIIYKPKSRSGVVLVYIPKCNADPVMSSRDNKFYFRTGEGFTLLPYEILKRLFASTESPDLNVRLDPRIVKQEQNSWRVHIILSNESSAVARDVEVVVTIENPYACESVTPEGFHDVSDVNPGVHLYTRSFNGVIHKGLNQIVGSFSFVMKKARSRSRRKLIIKVEVMADKMKYKSWRLVIHLTKTGLKVKEIEELDG